VPWFRWDGPDLLLRVQVQPRARRDELIGVCGEAVKVRLTAPPVEGKANDGLRSFLAGQFGIPKSRVVLERGQTSRNKLIRLRSPKRLPSALPLSR
jgi:uncharacterized protein (TIGR00251 family)